jgi:hypothetical protein
MTWNPSNPVPRRCPPQACAVRSGAPGLTLTAALLLSACTPSDPYFDKFTQIAVGDPRQLALDLLGPPTSANSVELAMLRLEELMWRSPVNDRLYVLFIVADRVAGKSALQ